MTTRVCTKCGIEKDINEFGWERRFHRSSRCKRCRVEDRMEYYENNKEKELAYKWDRQIRQREKAREYVTEYLRTKEKN